MEAETKKPSTSPAEFLPEELIQQIQSFLPANEAAQTCLLSKPWQRAWFTIPFLLFHQPPPSSNAAVKPGFLNLISQTLTRYHLNNLAIEAFSLVLRDKISDSVLKSWLDILINKIHTLQDLTISINCISNNVQFEFPSQIFSSKKLKRLNLDVTGGNRTQLCFSIHHLINLQALEALELSNAILGPRNLPNEIDLLVAGNLKHLKLTRVTIDDLLLQQMIPNLLVLEKLELKNCDSLRRIEIRSVSLKNLCLSSCSRLPGVTILTPKLVAFCYEGLIQDGDGALCFSDVVSVELRTTVRPYTRMYVGTWYFLWLIEFFVRSRRLTMYVEGWCLESRNIDLRRLQEVSFATREHVEILTLKLRAPEAPNSPFLDVFFSICNPKFVRVLSCGGGDSDTSFNKFFSTNLKLGRERKCCNPRGKIRCWRHYLKDIEYGYTKELEDGDSWESSVQWRNGIVDGPCNCIKLTWF